jgi:hypothetical protein
MGPKDIATATSMTETNVRQMLGSKVEAGQIKKERRGAYVAL